jgi:hypothetical protein
MKHSGANEWFRTAEVCATGPILVPKPQFAVSAAPGIRFQRVTSLVRGGGPFYNPSNTASEAVVLFASPPRSANRNALHGCLSAGEPLSIDSHFGFSQEH